ncbi:MAG: adenylate/guanylate cyclase domain-containing protein [Acidimicrobiia bacterium]|nr:adenylate/guanylate cyclase domain-containing protein [Acidimicrobiia bacterium]
MRPPTSYARSGEYSIAYQEFGEGPFDLVVVPPWVSHLDLQWEEPRLSRFHASLGTFARVLIFDKRGTGLSDRVPVDRLPTLEERVDDIRAVMDAAGSGQAALLGMSEGCSMAAMFAASHPRRTMALVLFGGFATRVWRPDYPWAPTTEHRNAWIELIGREWGKKADLEQLAPSVAGDHAFVEWFERWSRAAASPAAAVALARMNTEIDIRHLLPAIRVPTLVLHRTHDRDANVEEGRWMASRIPGARFEELPGADHLPWTYEPDRVIAAIQTFLTGSSPAPVNDRVLATVLFTDVVGSTELASRLGDRRFTDLMSGLERLARRQIEEHGGRAVKTLGDGILATFSGPARAIRAAIGIRDQARDMGISVRAGLHCGEVELLAGDVSGIAVHIGSRVAAMAEPGEVLVSRTVRDLVAGSGIRFRSRGSHDLKGVEGEWELLVVE